MTPEEIRTWVFDTFPDFDKASKYMAQTTINHYKENPLMLERISANNESPVWVIVRAWLEEFV